MSKIHLLRAFLNERLTAAADEIFGVVETTISEYQDEVVRLQSLLDIVLQPKIKPHRAELLPLTLSDSEFPPERQQPQVGLEWSPSRVQEDPGPNQIKEELRSSPKEEQLPVLEEDNSTPVFVRSNRYEDPTQSLHFYQAQKEGNGDGDPQPSTTTEQVKTEPGGEDYGESESTSVPQQLPGLNRESSSAHSEIGDTCGLENGDLLQFNQVKSKRTMMVNEQDSGVNTKSWKPTQLNSPSHMSATSCCCMVCGKSFHYMGSLFKHMQTHAKDKKGICGACGKCFQSTESMKDHLQTHFAARFSCNFCGKFFTRNGTLKTHMRIHTGEKPYRCPYCCKGFISGGDLKNHIRIHTGEKPFCCPDCGKSFTRSGHLKGHMRTHTVDK